MEYEKIGFSKVSNRGMLHLTSDVMDTLKCCKGDVIVFGLDKGTNNIFIKAVKEKEFLKGVD